MQLIFFDRRKKEEIFDDTILLSETKFLASSFIKESREDSTSETDES